RRDRRQTGQRGAPGAVDRPRHGRPRRGVLMRHGATLLAIGLGAAACAQVLGVAGVEVGDGDGAGGGAVARAGSSAKASSGSGALTVPPPTCASCSCGTPVCQATLRPYTASGCGGINQQYTLPEPNKCLPAPPQLMNAQSYRCFDKNGGQGTTCTAMGGAMN